MSDRTKKFGAELDGLILRGGSLLNAIQKECHPEQFKALVTKNLMDDKVEIDRFLRELPNFRDEYQAWYSEAQAVVKQVIPDRLADFVSYFEAPKGRKEITFGNYMIRDYLQGLHIKTNWIGGVDVDGSAAIPEFIQQLSIVKAAKATLESSLMNLRTVLQADLFDTEIEAAGALAKAGHLRAAGAICGVVLEKHLHQVCNAHNIKISKKHPGISDLIQGLREGSVITLVQWRFIQSLADIRNLCDHSKGREPSADEIGDLVVGTERILKQVN